MSRKPAWRVPAWYARPAPRLVFQHQLTTCGVYVRPVPPPRRSRGGFALAITLSLPDIGRRTITIVFPPEARDIPVVHVDGPTESPHRYGDGSRCMWYPDDPAERRWTRRDGPVVLLGHIVAHLIREEWWRRTGEWPGAEAPHSITADEEQDAA